MVTNKSVILPDPQTVAEEIYTKNVELLAQRRRAEQLLYGVSEAVFAIDTGMNITIFNHAAERMLGLSTDEAINQTVTDLIVLTKESGEVIRFETFCFQEDESKSNLSGVMLKGRSTDYFVNIKASTIGGLPGQKNECLITMTDVTREKQLEKTKDEFVSVTSHELRTPITIIKSYLWMLANERGGVLTPKQKLYIEKANGGIERMLNLINDTLSISKLDQGKMELKTEVIDTRKFLSEIRDEFRIKTDEKNISLPVKCPDNIKAVVADKQRLTEVFINLLGNALKFTSQGSITIEAENYAEESGQNYVMFRVTDTGRGLHPEDVPKLFKKFGRLDNSYQTVAEVAGTGLGLYITKSLVEKMGGRIWAQSDGPGKGTTVSFIIPILDTNKFISSIYA